MGKILWNEDDLKVGVRKKVTRQSKGVLNLVRFCSAIARGRHYGMSP